MSSKKFEFTVTNLKNTYFEVVRFVGEEEISRCYRFEIDLVSTTKDVNIDTVLQSPAQFKILRDNSDDILFNGYINEFYQFQKYNDYTYYRAILIPKLWWLEKSYSSRIFLRQTTKEFLTAILKEHKLSEKTDFEFILVKKQSNEDDNSQPTNKYHYYVCQYNETDSNFFHRWLEVQGMYYFFEHNEEREKIIITNSNYHHFYIKKNQSDKDNNKEDNYTLLYRQEGGDDDIIHSFVCIQKRINNKLHLRNYHYTHPSKPIDIDELEIDTNGVGTLYRYGNNFANPKEDPQVATIVDGNNLANIIKESQICRKRIFKGKSNVPYLSAGYLMRLKNHYREDFNAEYLITKVYHEGYQTAYLSNGLSIDLKDVEKKDYYKNEFEAIPSNLQYRSELITKKPKMNGFINAKIDAEGSGEYAELDDQGRYHVIMPFDVSNPGPNKGSVPLRMMQPYGGPPPNSSIPAVGMHFPLRKGTEVLIGFVNGDIDRPVIVGAVPNKITPSVTTNNNPKLSQILTSGGNKFIFNDKEDQEGILLSTPKDKAFICIGEPFKDAKDALNKGKNGDNGDNGKNGNSDNENSTINMGTEGSVNISAAFNLNLLSGKANATVFGASVEFFGGEQFSVYLGFKQELALAESLSISVGATQELFIGAVTDIAEADTKVTSLKTALSGTKTTISNVGSTITSLYNKLTGQNNAAATQGNSLTGQNNAVTTQNNSVTGQNNAASTQNNSVTGQNNAVTTQNNTVTTQNNTVTTQNNTASTTNVTVATSIINSAGNSTTI